MASRPTAAVYHLWVTILFDFQSLGPDSFDPTFFFLPGVTQILQWTIPKKSIQNSIDHFDITKAKVHRCLKMGQIRSNFMTWILRHDGDTSMSVDEIEATLAMLAVTGAETTAKALTGIFFPFS